MAKLNDLTGKKFGNWVVLYRNGSTKNKAAIWRCRCSICSSERDVVGYSLTQGKSTKCRSCVPRETLSKPFRNTRLYNIYRGMKARCHNPNSTSYERYGGKGIAMCSEWLTNPDAFFEWAMANGYHDGLSIDRIDNKQGYEPTNCRWVELPEQARNRTMNVDIVYNNAHYTLTDACKEAGVSYGTIRSYKTRHPSLTYQEVFDRYI